MTHMAPELLMKGHVSKASDVYAYGILLWELYTAQNAFKGVPRALLGHEVTRNGMRPQFPASCPFEFQLLACRCWESDPAIRPSFSQILDQLTLMRRKLAGGGSSTAGSIAGGGSLACSMPGRSFELGSHTVDTTMTGTGTGALGAATQGPNHLAEGETEVTMTAATELAGQGGGPHPAAFGDIGQSTLQGAGVELMSIDHGTTTAAAASAAARK